jgi:hypothetical protein
MNTGLHILYTANLLGNLELLPRLHTFLRQLKALPLDEGEEVMVCTVQPVARPTLLLDLGNACSPQVWHCAATGGRSVVTALDAMGYQAAHVNLTAEARARLRDNLISMALVDVEHPHEENHILFGATRLKGHSDLQIVLTPAATTRLEGNTLDLASVQAGQVGVVHLSAQPSIEAHTIFDLPSGLTPDPSIASVVEFILNEARLYQQKRG